MARKTKKRRRRGRGHHDVATVAHEANAPSVMSGNNDGRPTKHINMTSSSPPQDGPSFSGDGGGITLSTDTDTAYCTELSRRSIARAALHLGIEHMETSALDVLGSVLLGYLERVGDTIATNVEGSGRSSGHVNAYDVLNVVDQEAIMAATTAAAVQFQSSSSATQQLQQHHRHQQPQLDDKEQNNIMIEGSSSNSRGWEGLASFLFGSNWYSIPLEGEAETAVDTLPKDKDNKGSSSSSTIMNGATTTAMNGGGKGGPSTATSSSSGKILPTENTSKILSATTPTSAKSTTATTTTPGSSGAKSSGKGKQLSNMTPPPGVSVVGNEVIMGNTTPEEKNVSFSLERKNSKGASVVGVGGIGVNGNIDNSNNNDNGTNSQNNHSNNNNSTSSDNRWDAPYLNEVPPFPLVTTSGHIANPHCLSGTNIPLSMHDLATEQEACRDNHTSSLSNKKQRRGSSAGSSSAAAAAASSGIASWRSDIADIKLKIPKDVFATKDIIWGSMKQSDDSQKNMNGNTHKTTENEKLGGGNGGPLQLPKLPAVEMPSYVPNFFPPFPRTEETISSVPSVPTTAVMSDVMSRVSQKRKSPPSLGGGQKSNETTAALERSTVRHSLVELGKNAVGSSYWGSNWLNNDDDDDDVTRKSKEKLKFSNAVGQLTVTPGPSSSASASGRPSDNNAKKAAAGGGGADAQVVPLARASGSRVAKILEGSN